ncbi:MAG: septal ring lytic transglycosylase RlpA family protein [Pseudomonadota bacterium]
MEKMRLKTMSAAVLAATLATSLSTANAAQIGSASWYALRSITASGERMNPNDMTAAHRSLPFGTKVRVKNLQNGRSVVVRINDRGPFTGGRIIDVSKAAAAKLGMISSGTAKVSVAPLR